MVRLTRAQTRERNRAQVLAAARREFAERGYRDAKVDHIAERAGLTRGAVYSNFPGKRALYFSVLAEDAERPATPAAPATAETSRESLGAFARAWIDRLPLATDVEDDRRIGRDVLPEILADDTIREPFAQLMKLDAILLGLALERLRPAGPPPARLVRVAEAALTILHGASQMTAAAPGLLEPFDLVTVCEGLADLDLGGGWPPVPPVPSARPADDPWDPPDAVDALRGEPVLLTGDGVVAILGLHRLEAAEEAVRAAPPSAEVTAVVVTGDPGELAPLARLVVADVCGCLRRAFPASAWPGLRVVHDPGGVLAAAAGVPAVSDTTETAVRIHGGRIVARADGRGACHAAAREGTPSARRP
ncbi:TetR/AcrR family transcriptional regulator [Actinoallomurus purpureus]|uniref:TetR/AcrR family transcriptional regulator n=1 Tax=Actinoallomurus purpureus TaxID=478114 RepID=UPI002092E599|nr:TetR/AcrR family transcriptional regulator [Actinoallomurus purpureus]MCO6010642.1 TetR/AcrR family transcriptional regulator [Actinoallomurus purpureus]